MAVTGLDIELQAILTFGFDYIKQNPDVIEEVFSNFKRSHLAKLYGDREISKIKEFINENEIPVKIGFSLQPEKVPGIYLVLSNSTEDVGTAHLGDHGGIFSEPISNKTIIDTFVPASVTAVPASVTAVSSFLARIKTASDLSLDGVFQGMIFEDNKKEQYLISRIISNNEFEIVLEGDPPDYSKGTIKSSIDTEKSKMGHVFFTERVDMGIIGPASQNVTLWLYYLTIWILLRFKPVLEERCVKLHTFSATDLKKLNEKLPNNVYARWISFKALTDFTWIEDPYLQLDGISFGDPIEESGGFLADGAGGVVDESYLDSVELEDGTFGTHLNDEEE